MSGTGSQSCLERVRNSEMLLTRAYHHDHIIKLVTPHPLQFFLSYLSFWKVSFPAASASLVLAVLCPDSWRMLAHRRPSRETVDIRILSLLKCIVLIISGSCFKMAGVGISFVLSYMSEQRITRDFRASRK